jgi:hypothetical protein
MRRLLLCLAAFSFGCDFEPTDVDGDGWIIPLDCDDNNADVHPEAPEICDGLDNDCDDESEVESVAEIIDEGLERDWFLDADLDGHGGPITKSACEQPEGYLNVETDCDDDDPDQNPDAEEVCNGEDDDCDTEVDEGSANTTTYYPDVDGDGYGDGISPVTACAKPADHVENGDDCVDTDAAINPDTIWFFDLDGDGYGDVDDAQPGCTAPTGGYVLDFTDCDPFDGKSYPGADEICDDSDNDCNGVVDDDPTDPTTYYADDDKDGYGDKNQTKEKCDKPKGHVKNDDDCDDTDPDLHPETYWYRDIDDDGYGDPADSDQACKSPSNKHIRDNTDCEPDLEDSYPGAIEVCDGVDNDCNGDIDDDPVDIKDFYADVDGDEYGDASSHTIACDAPKKHVEDDSDCNDEDGDAWEELLWYLDDDDDGYGDPATETLSCGPPTKHYVDNSDDCDDELPDVFVETLWYLDDDGDEYGDPATEVTWCGAPDEDHVDNGDDCNDEDPGLHPETEWFFDGDDDDYGAETGSIVQCLAPDSDYVLVGGDCKDGNEDINPGEEEECLDGANPDGVDDNCNNEIDEGCPSLWCGDIEEDTTWDARDGGHFVTCDIHVLDDATLTVEDGALVAFLENTSLIIGATLDPGVLDVQGTDQGVVFTSWNTVPDPGDWNGVRLTPYADDSTIEGLTIQYAGQESEQALYVDDVYVTIIDSIIELSDGDGLKVSGEPELLVKGTLFQDNANYGMVCDDTPCIDPTPDSFTGNQFIENGLPLYLNDVDDLGSLANDNLFQDNVANHVRAGAGNLENSATWRNIGTPIHLGWLNVRHPSKAPVLTLDPGVELRFDLHAEMIVGGENEPGDLIIAGTEEDPVVITSNQTSPQNGDMGFLILASEASELSDIQWLELSYAGQSYGAGLHVDTYAGVSVRDTTVRYSKGSGIAVNGRAELLRNTVTDNDINGIWLGQESELIKLDENTITHNDEAAIHIFHDLTVVNGIGKNNVISDNGENTIRLQVDGAPVDEEITWVDPGVPYHVQGDLRIAGTNAHLTLEDNVELYFDTEVGLEVGPNGEQGTLTINGDRTDGQPVVLSTWADLGPATWDGVSFWTNNAQGDLTGFDLNNGGGAHGPWPGGIYIDGGTVSLDDCYVYDNLEFGVHLPSGNLSMTDCTIESTEAKGTAGPRDGTGVYIRGTISEFTGNTITANDGYGLAFDSADAVSGMNADNDISSNGFNVVYVYGGGISQDATWPALDIPYRVNGNILDVTATWTVTGAHIQFSSNLYVYVGGQNWEGGDLIATDAVFSSSAPTPGAWGGFEFTNASGISNMSGSTVEYANRGIVVKSASITLHDNLISNSLEEGICLHSAATVTENELANNGTVGIRCAQTGDQTDLSTNTYDSNTDGETQDCDPI